MKNKKSFLRRAAGMAFSTAVATFTVGTQTLYALDGTWNRNGNQNWNTANNWVGNTIASGADFTATLGDSITSNRIITLNVPITIGNITAADTTHNYTIARDANPNTNILTLDRTSGVPTIDVAASTVVGQIRTLTITSIIEGNDGLKKTGPGTLILGTEALDNTHNYTGGTQILAGTLFLNETGQIPASSGTVILGDTSGTASAELQLDDTSTTVSNAMTVNAGSSGTKTIANRGNNSVEYSGSITANDNLTILGANNAGNLTISGTASTIASGKTVAFSLTAAGNTPDRFVTDSALWSGDGGITYTSAGGLNNIAISGAKTYTGGAALDAMSGTGIMEVRTSSVGPANTPASGPFGTGTLSIGATKMRADEAGNITIGNAITFTDNPTFTTVANEKSLIFSGDASLGADRTLTVETGSTVATAAVEFSGEISGSGFGIIKEGAGKLLLNGTNTFTGLTSVNSGTLGGNGSIAGDVTVAAAANLAPGASIGTLSIGGGLNISALAGGAGQINCELGPIAASDRIDVTGTLDIGTDALGFSDFDFDDLGGLENGTYTLITSSSLTGSLDTNPANLTGAVGSGTGTLQISDGGTGDNIELVITGTPPTLVSIADDQSGGPITAGTLVTYTVTFSSDMDDTTVSAADFDNAGTSAITIGTITETTPGVFTIQVTPTDAGTLQLRIPVSATMTDADGNPLDNDPALLDDTIITVNSTDLYAAWSDGEPFGGDANGDGVSNGLAFLLGAADPDVSALDRLPTVSEDGSGGLVMTFDCLASAPRGGAALTLEWDGDLAGAWLGVPVPGAEGDSNPIEVSNGTGSVSFVATDGGTNGNGDALLEIQATITDATESADGKLFGRLQATQN